MAWSNDAPLKKRRDGLTHDHVVHQRNSQQFERALHAPRVFYVVRRRLMVSDGIAANAQNLLGAAPQRVSYDFPGVNHYSIVLTARKVA